MLRRFGGPCEGRSGLPEVFVGKDSPDPNWAMPDFLREAFRCRATGILEEVERKRVEPVQRHVPLSIDEIFAKPDCESEHVPTDEDHLRAEFWHGLRPVEKCSIDEIFAHSANEYEKWKSHRFKQETTERTPETTPSETGNVWRDGIFASVKMITIAPWMNFVATIARLAGYPTPNIDSHMERCYRQLNDMTKEIASRVTCLIEKGPLAWAKRDAARSANATGHDETHSLSRIDPRE